MKIKNKFLTILSSVFGVVAICGLFSMFLFSTDKKKIETKADDITIQTIRNVNVNFYYSPDGVNSNNERIIFSDFYDNTMTISYNTALSESINGPTDLYRIWFAFSIDIFSDSIGAPNDNNYTLVDSSLNNSIVVSTAPLSNVSLFSYKLYLNYFSFKVQEIHIDDYNTSYRVLYDARFDLLSPVDNSLLSYVEILDGRISGIDDFGVFLTASSLATRLSYNSLPLSALPTRDFVFLNSFEFDAMASDYSIGFSLGYSSGYEQGYASGNNTGYNLGYNAGYNVGVESQYTNIVNSYNDGYNAGLESGLNSNSTVATIFSGILQIGMLPINFFLSIFNFEILGINMSSFVSALLTVCLTIIVIKTVTGKSGGD